VPQGREIERVLEPDTHASSIARDRDRRRGERRGQRPAS
jgi:hypothetical protein